VHQITSTHRPSVDVVVDGVKVMEIHLEVEITMELEAVCAIVSTGRLIALRSGRANVKAELRCEGVPVTSMITEIDLHLQLGLGSGFVLLEAPAVVRLPDAPHNSEVVSTPPSPDATISSPHPPA